MNKQIRKIRDKCTPQQAKFIELLVNDELDKFEAHKKAGFKAKTEKVASASICRMLKDVNCVAYKEALELEIERKLDISRGRQLRKLNTVYQIAEDAKNPTAMVSAIREQNEMLGYHRDLAPNKEREAAKKDRSSKEQKEIDKLVNGRLKELSEPKPKTIKIGKAG
jgi:hypothetical protein